MPKPKKVPPCPHSPCPGHTYSQGLHRARICDTCNKPDRTSQYAAAPADRKIRYVLFDPAKREDGVWRVTTCFVAMVAARSPEEVEELWPTLQGLPFSGLTVRQRRMVVKLAKAKIKESKL
jgi:hypothetical protein